MRTTLNMHTVVIVSVSLLALNACSTTKNIFKASPKKQQQVARVSDTDLAPMVDYGASAGLGSGGVHTVLAGDTVYSIAKQYKLNTRDIIDANDLVAPFRLGTGMRIKLPPPQTYKVRVGDNVPLIAKTFSVSQTELVSLNNISSPYRLTIGQDLRLPRPLVVHASFTTTAPTTINTDALASVWTPPVTSTNNNGVVMSETLPSNIPTHMPVQVVGMPPQPVASATTGGGMMMVPPVKPNLQTAALPAPMGDEFILPPRTGARFLKPVDGSVVSRYGPKSGGLYNEGINIAAPRGTPVRAAEAGKVVYVGNAVDGYGNLVLVKHAGGYITAYAHMDKTFAKEGQILKRGHTIGTVGSTGNVDRAQLHFEVRRGRESVDPTTMI